MEAEISRKSKNEVTDNFDTFPADTGPSASTNETLSYKMESESLIETRDEVTECLDVRVFNPPMNVSPALPADFVLSTSTIESSSYAIEAEALTETKDEVKECRCTCSLNSSLDISTTYTADLEPSQISSQMLSNEMETEVVISMDEVTESLDARVYQIPLNTLPNILEDNGAPIGSSQTSLIEHSIENPEFQEGSPLPAEFKPSSIFGPTPPTEQAVSNLNPQKGFVFPLPTKAVQNPTPKTIARYLPNKDASSYELKKFKENRMIIFDHDRFFSGPSRPGTDKDEKLLRETFGKFRFKIDPTYQNLDMVPLLETVKNFALGTDFSAYGCICVAILTHGHKEPGFLKAYDRRYSEYDIFKHFDASKNHTLAAKPIIFIIQAIKLFKCVAQGDYGGIGFSTLGTACRGPQPSSKVNTGGKTPAPQLDYGEDGENYHLPTEADRIVFHSSYVGKASIREPEDGSWFIQTLCKKIQEHALTHDLETIFRMVRKAVALDCDTEQDWKQMPVVTSTTLRELYLFPNPQQDNSQEEDQPRPASPFVLVCPTNDPNVYPSSHQLAERLNEHVRLRGTETVSVPDAAPALMQLHHLPCCCFVEYFEYLKNCLENFSRHNKEDLVAKSLLKLVERTGSGSEYNLQKFSYIQSMWEHLEINKNSFPPDGFSFVHRMYVPLKEPDTERLEPL